MIGSAIAEYNVAVSSELHWLFLPDFKWSFLLVFVWLFSPGSNKRMLIVERPPERVATVYQSSFPLLSSKMAYLCDALFLTLCIQESEVRFGTQRSQVQILSHRLKKVHAEGVGLF